MVASAVPSARTCRATVGIVTGTDSGVCFLMPTRCAPLQRRAGVRRWTRALGLGGEGVGSGGGRLCGTEVWDEGVVDPLVGVFQNPASYRGPRRGREHLVDDRA